MKKSKANREDAVDGADKRPSASSSQAFDPALAALFASSFGPVKSLLDRDTAILGLLPDVATGNITRHVLSKQNEEEQLTSKSAATTPRATLQESSTDVSSSDREVFESRSWKRKRNRNDDDVEGRYIQRLGQEEAKEEAKRQGAGAIKRQRQEKEINSPLLDTTLDSGETHQLVEKEIPGPNMPQHESQTLSGKEIELEKASRTVFLSNVSTAAIKSKHGRKTLADHLGSFLPALQERGTPHKIESLRFRSTAFSSNGLPRKAAYAKKELMDSTTKSTNAYVVYTTHLAAKEAVNGLNGTVVLDRHLRVDGVAHPAKIDHRRCVFVGNLSFVDDETAINTAQDEENNKPVRKGKEPADAEEGLWRQFSKAGVVESVRVIRDKTTRVGKGFAYVQFQDVNAVEKALLYHEKKFPPMLPRMLRVTRAKSFQTSNKHSRRTPQKEGVSPSSARGYKPNPSSEVQTLSGRASKLLGRAGAAQLKGLESLNRASTAKIGGISKTPESKVFEGYRASITQKKGGVKMEGSGKKQGKPRTRSSKRGSAFKASGGKRNRT